MSAKQPQPKASILQIQPYVAGKSKAGGAGRVIKLSSNENPLGPSPAAIQAYLDAAASLHRYPEGSCADLRMAIAEVYSLPADRIICGAGSDEIIGLLVHAYTNPGDEVLYSQHGFLMYKIYALSHGAVPVTAPEKALRTDVDALLRHVTPRTRIVFVANPNNPTGSYISKEELAYLRQQLPEHVVLAVDAAYAEYAEAKDYSNGQELAATSGNTIMLRTFSKIYGLSALRLGWAFASAEMIDVLNRVRSPFNVNTPAMAAGIASVRDLDYTRRAAAHNREELARVSAALSRMGLSPMPSAGNFVLVAFPETPGKTSADANQYLMGQGIIPREVVNYGLPRYLRISIGTGAENDALISAMESFCRR